MPGQGKIVVLGVFVADTTHRADRMPRMGETLLGKSFALGPGGKGSNQAVAAGRAGADAHMITKIGEDAFGDMAMALWDRSGVTPAVTRMETEATGCAFIFIDDATGDNAIIITPGASGTITPADIDARRDLIAGADIFMTQLEQPLDAAMCGLKLAKEAGVTTLLNPAPAADLPDEMLALCDIITPNETEAEMLTGQSVKTLEDAEKAAAILRKKGIGTVILTLGERGALLVDDTRSLHVPAMALGDVVETTGAGDAFNGGFATALAQGQPIEDAVKFGCATAGLSVTRPGAAASMPTRSEIDQALAAQ
ncbi:ribokinase [Shimia ponticola]|uniref:ribokinase n=1 Tax=Shimia ponticola TaxID=2582893 RepID=UPI0011BF43A2|nr:ribokinase [Shimia ponticola]